jgi:hypothetical protein
MLAVRDRYEAHHKIASRRSANGGSPAARSPMPCRRIIDLMDGLRQTHVLLYYAARTQAPSRSDRARRSGNGPRLQHAAQYKSTPPAEKVREARENWQRDNAGRNRGRNDIAEVEQWTGIPSNRCETEQETAAHGKALPSGSSGRRGSCAVADAIAGRAAA